jgi:hypothetical protein
VDEEWVKFFQDLIKERGDVAQYLVAMTEMHKRHPDFDRERVNQFWLTHPNAKIMWPNTNSLPDIVASIDDMWHLITNTPGCGKVGG